MPATPEESIPTITVAVGTPPPFTPPTNIQESLDSLFYVYSPTRAIFEDKTSVLLKYASGKNTLRTSLIKRYLGRAPVSPPPPPSPPSPPTVSKSFPSSAYNVDDLPGVVPGLIEITTSPPASPPPPPPPPPSKLTTSTIQSFDNTPSAVLIPACASIISYPYFAPEAPFHRNGVLLNALTINPAQTTYLWESYETVLDQRTGQQVNVLQPREGGAQSGGSVVMTPQPRDAENPRKPVKLTPYIHELSNSATSANGKEINSFSLMLAIVPGCNDAQNQAPAWNIKIEFGDVTVKLQESRAEAEISVKGNKEPVRITINPSSGQYTTSGFGERPYILTFIPVWNGLLVSDSPPGSTNWPDKVTFVQKHPGFYELSEINNALYAPSSRAKPRSVPFNLPLVICRRLGQNFTQAGISVPDNPKNRLQTGKTLSVTYHRCGGSLKFVPIQFPTRSRISYLVPGTLQPFTVDLSQLATSPPPPPTTKPPKPTSRPAPKIEEDIFKLTPDPNSTLLPMFYYPDPPNIDYRTTNAPLPITRNDPVNVLAVEFFRVNSGFRRPVQLWGLLKYTQENSFFQFSNADGFLTTDACPQPRIISVQVSRSLDGSNGNIVWDRYDPLLGTLVRPNQQAGSITISVQGGVDTTPGTIFTGLAIGHGAEDSPDENTINIPLYGKESKLNGEGGLRLINAPFFDGYDHVAVMQFLCNYGGVELKNLAVPFRLPASFNIQAPLIELPTGTPVWDAMGEISKLAGTLFYFDRFGLLTYIEVERSTGTNWAYPNAILQDYNDEPDFSTTRNLVVLSSLIADERFNRLQIEDQFANLQFSAPTLLTLALNTNPFFAWAKMMFYAIPGVLPNQGEFNRVALRVAQGTSRPRATAKTTIPGNAQVELLDTFNSNWFITGVSHRVDLQRKEFRTDLNLELAIPFVPSGTATILPLANVS